MIHGSSKPRGVNCPPIVEEPYSRDRKRGVRPTLAAAATDEETPAELLAPTIREL